MQLPARAATRAAPTAGMGLGAAKGDRLRAKCLYPAAKGLAALRYHGAMGEDGFVFRLPARAATRAAPTAGMEIVFLRRWNTGES